MCLVPRCSCYTHHLGPWFRYGVGIIFFTWPCKLKTHTHKRESRAHIQWNRSRRWKRKKQADPKKLGKWERVIGLAVDGVLEACVKPGALTAGFKGRGEGYGLESGLLLHIFWRLNSYPPPPTPLWTFGGIISLSLFVGVSAAIYRHVSLPGWACRRARSGNKKKKLVIRYSAPGPAGISSQKFPFNHRTHRPCWYALAELWWGWDGEGNNARVILIELVRSRVFNSGRERLWVSVTKRRRITLYLCKMLSFEE